VGRGLRQNWTTIDGKYETLDHRADGIAQKFGDNEKKSVYWRLGMLRAVLVSAASRSALGQWAMRPVQNGETDPEKLRTFSKPPSSGQLQSLEEPDLWPQRPIFHPSGQKPMHIADVASRWRPPPTSAYQVTDSAPG
jgi:hypothetical protein